MADPTQPKASDSKMPPKLKGSPNLELLPSVLTVIDPDNCTNDHLYANNSSGTHSVEQIYHRVYPPSQLGGPDGSVGLSVKNKCGEGHHSLVYHATFTLPKPPVVSFTPDSGETTVVAKLGFTETEHREHISNEAKILYQIGAEVPNDGSQSSYC